MRLASLSIVKLLRPHLGFGSSEVQPPPLAIDEPEGADETRISLLQLAEKLESAFEAAAPGTRVKAASGLKELALLLDAQALSERNPDEGKQEDLQQSPEHTLCEELSRTTAFGTAAKVRAAPPPKGLEGRKVAAIGFGRQDISGLAAAMIEGGARVEFLARGHVSALSEFDLLLLNASSTETLKREAACFREVLAMGIPAIVAGSRAALNVLRDSPHRRTWDFISKPLHMDELMWRAVTLLSRHEEAACAAGFRSGRGEGTA